MAAQLQQSCAETAGAWGYACLEPGEAALVKALVDHMMLAAKFAGNGTEKSPDFYIDAALAANLGSGAWPHMHPVPEADVPEQPEVSGTALYRVAITATNVFCKRRFDELFDEISDKKQKGVLRLLDSIKLVFQDGSGAGVFFAIVYQTMMKVKLTRS